MSMRGKGAMVWKLRNWAGGDPAAQVADARLLGLEHVSIKVLNEDDERWEASTVKRQNADLLPETVAALREANIGVKGWGWVTGAPPERQADAALAVCAKYSLIEFDVDAEAGWNRPGMSDEAEAYCTIAAAIPFIGLCSYRFPLTMQPNFPVRACAPFMDYWAPQVYFIGDVRPTGGATQLASSFDQYMRVRPLPFTPVAPTYDAAGWRATGPQLTAFFARAKSLGCAGFMVWDLPQASSDQRAALAAFSWSPPTTTPADEIRAEAERLREIAARLDVIASEC